MNSEPRSVVVLGASARPERFAYKAVQALVRHGHRVIRVHPRAVGEVHGIPAFTSLAAVREPVHTLTLYLGPGRSRSETDTILALGPGRVILNPGTESPSLQAALEAAGIPWVHDCTLRMLEDGRF